MPCNYNFFFQHQKEIARPSLPAKKYSEVSNAHVSNKSIPMQPKQIQRPETNKAREYTAASAVNTQLVSDKSKFSMNRCNSIPVGGLEWG